MIIESDYKVYWKRKTPRFAVGEKVGRWRVDGYTVLNKNKGSYAVTCECGTVRAILGRVLEKGVTMSCGCSVKTHGESNANRTTEYTVWQGMLDRCHNPNGKDFANYGGRGITVSEAWREDYAQFLADMGRRPEGVSLDRFDNSLGYSADNCRWATASEQINNRRNTKYYEFGGERLTSAEWAERVGGDRHTVAQRVDRLGWSVERAVTTPAGTRGPKPDDYVGGPRYLEHAGERLPMSVWAERLGGSRSLIWDRIDKLGWSVEKAVTTPARPKPPANGTKEGGPCGPPSKAVD